jgi:hypothetical protein
MPRAKGPFACELCGRQYSTRRGMKFEPTEPTLPKQLRPKVVPKPILGRGRPQRYGPVRQERQATPGIWRCADLAACAARVAERQKS